MGDSGVNISGASRTLHRGGLMGTLQILGWHTKTKRVEFHNYVLLSNEYIRHKVYIYCKQNNFWGNN